MRLIDHSLAQTCMYMCTCVLLYIYILYYILYRVCACAYVLQSMVVMEQDDSQVPSQPSFGLLREIGREKKKRQEKKSGKN